jgi:hypothetical protein
MNVVYNTGIMVKYIYMYILYDELLMCVDTEELQ